MVEGDVTADADLVTPLAAHAIGVPGHLAGHKALSRGCGGGWGDLVEQLADDVVVELVADDPAVALGGDGAAGAQVPQGLGDGGVADAGGGGEVGDADRSGGLDGEQQAQPGGVGEQREPPCPGGDLGGVAEARDGVADLLRVDDPVPGAFGGKQVHADSLPEEPLYI